MEYKWIGSTDLEKQYQENDAITLTAPEMTRFFISMKGQLIYVFMVVKMGKVAT